MKAAGEAGLLLANVRRQLLGPHPWIRDGAAQIAGGGPGPRQGVRSLPSAARIEQHVANLTAQVAGVRDRSRLWRRLPPDRAGSGTAPPREPAQCACQTLAGAARIVDARDEVEMIGHQADCCDGGEACAEMGPEPGAGLGVAQRPKARPTARDDVAPHAAAQRKSRAGPQSAAEFVPAPCGARSRRRAGVSAGEAEPHCASKRCEQTRKGPEDVRPIAIRGLGSSGISLLLWCTGVRRPPWIRRRGDERGARSARQLPSRGGSIRLLAWLRCARRPRGGQQRPLTALRRRG